MITLLEKDAWPSTVRRLAPNSTAPSAFVRRCYHLIGYLNARGNYENRKTQIPRVMHERKYRVVRAFSIKAISWHE